MMLYISALDHARKLKFIRYVHLPSINKCFNIGMLGEMLTLGYAYSGEVIIIVAVYQPQL